MPRPWGIFFQDGHLRQGRPSQDAHAGAAVLNVVHHDRANVGLRKQVAKQVGVLQRAGGVDDGQIVRHRDFPVGPGRGRGELLTSAASASHWGQPCLPSD